jgi:hypothetical protein
MPAKSMPCIVCQSPITPTIDSREHVFPNAVGGRLKVREFICRSCNSGAGETWDSALSEQMQPFCHLFAIVRDRRELPPLPIVTTAGEKLMMLPKGGFTLTKPELTRARIAEGTAIRIQARDMAEARRMLAGLKKTPQSRCRGGAVQGRGVDRLSQTSGTARASVRRRRGWTLYGEDCGGLRAASGRSDDHL